MSHTESFRASDGVSVAFHHLKPADGTKVGMPPVFLVHGFSSNSQISWIDTGLTPTLVDVGREVFAVDARGHGLSDKPHDSEFYGMTRMGRDLIELWDSLGFGQVDLVGHSMGSVVALVTTSRPLLACGHHYACSVAREIRHRYIRVCGGPRRDQLLALV